MSTTTTIQNSTQFRNNIRQKFLEILEDDRIANNLEIAIYNYAIREATTKKIIRKWENSSFVILYMDRLRTIYTNLTKYPEFLEKIKIEELTPKDLTFITHQEIHEAKWADLIEKKKILDANKYTTNVAASTTLFTCSKCKSNRCTFYSLQIRSCDEGETIFITCMDCGKRWKRNS